MNRSADSGERVGTRPLADSQGSGQASLQPSLEEMGRPEPDGSMAESLSSSARDAARTASRAVREQASAFAADIGHELSETAEAQKHRGVEALQGFVRAIHVAADELDQQSPQIAGYVRDAASKVESLSSNIGQRDVNQLLRSVTELARSQPVLFFGGAVVAGFALSRFLKSSASGQPARQSADFPEHMRSAS